MYPRTLAWLGFSLRPGACQGDSQAVPGLYLVRRAIVER